MGCNVTVIVPVYNVEKFIDKCVQSVIDQTMTDIEVILVDDGSTDNSLARCREWANKDSRVKVYHQENQGVSVARNLGIEKSAGKYIAFIDSDDWIDPNYLEVYTLWQKRRMQISASVDSILTILMRLWLAVTLKRRWSLMGKKI